MATVLLPAVTALAHTRRHLCVPAGSLGAKLLTIRGSNMRKVGSRQQVVTQRKRRKQSLSDAKQTVYRSPLHLVRIYQVSNQKVSVGARQGSSAHSLALTPNLLSIHLDIRFRVRQIACMEFYAFACLDSGELLQICTKTKMRARLQPDSDEPATTARGGTVPVANLVPFGSYREVRILQIACGRHHICAIDRKGRIFAWWGNKLGQCGTGKRSVKPIKSPRQIKRFGVGELMRTADTIKVQHIVDLFAPHASVHLPLPLSHLLAFFPLRHYN